jgi:hypothetical protein
VRQVLNFGSSFAVRCRYPLLVIKLPSVQWRHFIEEGQMLFSAESPPRLADVDDLRLGFLLAFCCHGFSLIHFTFDLVVLLPLAKRSTAAPFELGPAT